MAQAKADRVWEQTDATGGTGALTLIGPVTGAQSFLAGWGASGEGDYVAWRGADWEVGHGSINAGGTTLTRSEVYASSNAGALVNFTAGAKQVADSVPAHLLKFLNHRPIVVASAATCDIGAPHGGVIEISGAVTITSFGTVKSRVKFVRLTGAPLLTHGANLVLPRGLNIQGAAGDMFVAISDDSATPIWRVRSYQFASGAAAFVAGDFTGVVTAGDGSLATPGFSFGLDPNTGIRRVSADKIAIVTAGTDGIVQDSAVRIGLQGTINASARVFIENSAAGEQNARLAATHATFAGSILTTVGTRASGGNYAFFEGYSSAGADREIVLLDNGQVLADGAYSSAGADIGEWMQYHPDHAPKTLEAKEENVGIVMVLIPGGTDGWMRPATKSDIGAIPIKNWGVVSRTCHSIGNSRELNYRHKYKHDDFGRKALEYVEAIEWEEKIVTELNGIEHESTRLISFEADKIPKDMKPPVNAKRIKIQRPMLNPEYDDSKSYVPPSKRLDEDIFGYSGRLRVNKKAIVPPEWGDPIGSTGKIDVYWVK